MIPRTPPPGPLEHDEEGDPLPQPAPASDLADLIQLLEYARTKDFQIGPFVQVGKIRLQVADIRQARKIGDLTGRATAAPEPSIWQMTGAGDDPAE